MYTVANALTTIIRNIFRLGNFEGNLSNEVNNKMSGSSLNEYVAKQFDASITWDDIKWIKRLESNLTMYNYMTQELILIS